MYIHVVKEQEGSSPYSRSDELPHSFLFHQVVVEEGSCQMARAPLHWSMMKQSPKKQRRFHVGVEWQNDVVGRSLGHGGNQCRQRRNPV